MNAVLLDARRRLPVDVTAAGTRCYPTADGSVVFVKGDRTTISMTGSNPTDAFTTRIMKEDGPLESMLWYPPTSRIKTRSVFGGVCQGTSPYPRIR
jgi:hypothetical protein